jgi:nitroreductase
MLPIDDAIRTRKTVKMQVEPETPRPADANLRETLDELIALAGYAPFHKACDRSHRGASRVVEPWRFYVLDASACRSLIPVVTEKAERPGRIPYMLAAADALIQATWLPNPPEEGEEPAVGGAFVPTMANQEHIAAAAAAVQTLLLAATARGLTTYWSSGGFLRSPGMFDLMGIPPEQILLGSIFIFPDDYENETWSPGGMRVRRSEAEAWAEWVKVPASDA